MATEAVSNPSEVETHASTKAAKRPKPTPFIPALLIVDFQEDFCPPNGTLAIPDGRSILSTVLSLLRLPSFHLLIATKDFHPPNHVSFASNHPNSTPFASTTIIQHPSDPSQSYTTRLWPDHCIQGTEGSELVKELKSAIEEMKLDIDIVEKGKDHTVEMYSCFEDPFAVSVSRVEGLLREKGITDVFVVGLAGDYCVKSSVVDAAKKGWRVWVVREGVRSVDEGDEGWGKAMEEMKAAGRVEVVSMEGPEMKWLNEPKGGVEKDVETMGFLERLKQMWNKFLGQGKV